MICALCSRPLLRATVQIGAQAIGPQCAKQANLLPPRRARVRVVHRQDVDGKSVTVERDEFTIDLFNDPRV